MDLNNLERMGRRRFMRNLAGLGLSSKAVEELTQDEISEITHDPEEEIPVLEGYRDVRSDAGEVIDREPEYGTVSRDRWERLLSTQDVLEEVGSLLEDEFGREDPRISLAFRGMEDSPTGFGVEVHTDYNEEEDNRKTAGSLENVLPNELTGTVDEDKIESQRDGIPIKVVETDVKSTSYLGENHTDVPGAAPCEVEISDGIAVGTIAAVFYDNYEGHGWVTAEHVVDGSVDDVVYQRTDNNPSTSEDPFGVVDEMVSEQNGAIDCAFIDKDLEYDEDQIFYIAESDYSDPRGIYAEGIITDETLRNNTDGNYTVHMQGSNSGRVETTVTGTRATWSGDVYAVITDAPPDGGDSGGPIFRTVNTDNGEEARICGVVKGSHDSDGDDIYEDCLSTTAETVENKLGGYF